MYKFLIVIVVVCFAFGSSKALEPIPFFQKIKNKNQETLPDFFKVRVESDVIDLQMNNLPKEMLEFNQKPALYLLFKKGHSPILHLEGVLEYYANYFAPYEEVIQHMGIFIGVDNFNNFKKFSKEFVIRAYETSYGYRFKVREREGLTGDYGEYFYNQDLVLNRIEFYEEGKMNGKVKVFFKEIENNRSVPSKVIVTYEKPEIGGLKEFSLTFTDYQTESKLGEKFFLE